MSVHAQSANTIRPVATQDTQWEYLIVSYGKTLFGDPEKTLAYRSIGLAATAQEANEIQRSLDVLGRFGWEVVTIVGTIGGDQQMVMKRRYDKNRVSNEATQILKGREIYLKDLIDILERAKRARAEAASAAEYERSKPGLIDLDAVEAEESRRQAAQQRHELYAKAFASEPWAARSDIKIDASPYEKTVSITISVNLTDEMLKNGNTYRRSQVKDWIDLNVMPQVRKVLHDGDVNITVTAVISHLGKNHQVLQEKLRYSNFMRYWSTN